MLIITENIWASNPELITYPSFKQLKEEYGADKSQEIMKALYLVYDAKSHFRALGLTDEGELQSKASIYLGDVKWGDLSKQIETYKEYIITPSERHLMNLSSQIEKAQGVLSDWTPITKELTSFIKSGLELTKLQREYLEIYKLVQAEKEEITKGAGGKALSLLERRAH